tara:strand:+ start:80 stop:385 length:306 start_codon:yes stop_codon:yes gene_type:complete
MKTPILDEFIEELQELKDGNFSLTKDLEERLIEFKNIKAAINYRHSSTELPNQDTELEKLAKNKVKKTFNLFFDKILVTGDGIENIKNDRPRGIFTNIKKE